MNDDDDEKSSFGFDPTFLPLKYPLSAKSQSMTDRNVWRRRDESEFSLFICAEAALTRSLVEIPE